MVEEKAAQRRRPGDERTFDLRTNRAERLRLIKELEARLKSRVIVFIGGDREGASKEMIDADVRVVYDHLAAIAPSQPEERIDLFLYSNGGDVDVPWRLVSVIREHAKKFGVLIPYRAYSAATMVVLGADEIVPTRKAELGPIDAAVSFDYEIGGRTSRATYRVEDTMAYVAFFQEKIKLKDPVALAEAMAALTTEVGAVELGEIYRTQRHTRVVAEMLMGCRNDKPTEAKMKKIIDTLSRRIYTHSHSLSRGDLRALGLPLADQDPSIESAIWRLFELYERDLRLREPIFKDVFIGDRSSIENSVRVTAGVVESETLLDEYVGTYRVRRRRALQDREWTVAPDLSVPLPDGISDARADELSEALEPIVTVAKEQAVLAARATIDDLTASVVLGEEWLNDSWRRTVGQK